MKVLSLFDGISCARVALERVGIPVEAYYASEIDKYAIQVSQKNYPNIQHIGSVTEIVAHTEPFDLLIGGSPCQDLSIAKKDRKGLDGERSGLFWEYVRILKENEPKYFILENVASMPKEAKAIITEALGVEPIMINASLVSAQNRKRLFWTNIPNVTLPEDRGILLKDILEEEVDEKYKVNISEKYGLKGLSEYKAKALTATSWKGYGNDGVSILQYRRTYWRESDTNKMLTLTANMGTGGNNIPYVEGEGGYRKLTPIECERLQGLPDNYTEGISNTQRYKCCGNAFNVDVVAHILSFIPK